MDDVQIGQRDLQEVESWTGNAAETPGTDALQSPLSLLACRIRRVQKKKRSGRSRSGVSPLELSRRNAGV